MVDKPSFEDWRKGKGRATPADMSKAPASAAAFGRPPSKPKLIPKAEFKKKKDAKKKPPKRKITSDDKQQALISTKLEDSVRKALEAEFFGDLHRGVDFTLTGYVDLVHLRCQFCGHRETCRVEEVWKTATKEAVGEFKEEFEPIVRALRAKHARCWLKRGAATKLSNKRQKLF